MATEIKQVSSYRLPNVVRDVIRFGAQISHWSEAEFVEHCVLKHAYQVASERIDVLSRAHALRDEQERSLAQRLSATAATLQQLTNINSHPAPQRAKQSRSA